MQQRTNDTRRPKAPYPSYSYVSAFIDTRRLSAPSSVSTVGQGATTHTTDQVAEEVPVAIVFHNSRML